MSMVFYYFLMIQQLLAASGLQVCSLRLGQISGGAPNGAWATSDWVPILVKSSLAIGALPLVTGVSLMYSAMVWSTLKSYRLLRGSQWTPHLRRFWT